MKKVISILFVALFMTGCGQKEKEVTVDQISVAAVQKEIKIGMSGADVVEALGSPNMITTDSERRESWVYDKISTDQVSSSQSQGLLLLFFGTSGSTSSSSSTQRTLTIIIKFDSDGLVRDYSYRQSSF